jgi:hypothetical protein
MNKKPIFDVDAFNAYLLEEVPQNDIRRVVKRARVVYPTTLHDLVKGMDCGDVRPSDLSIMECMIIINKYVDKQGAQMHPVYVVDTLLEKQHVKIGYDKIVALRNISDPDSEEIVIKANRGIFTNDPVEAIRACTATGIAYTTTEDKKGGISDVFKDSRKCKIFGLEPVAVSQIRSYYRGMSRSPNAVRDEIYDILRRDTAQGAVITDMFYDTHKFKVVHTETVKMLTALKQKMEKNLKAPIKYQMKGNLPATYTEVVKDTEFEMSPQTIMLAKFISQQTIGGGNTKRGALTSSCVYGEMSGSVGKVNLMVRDIMMVAEQYKVKIVRFLGESSVNVNIVRTLYMNNIVVISDLGKGTFKEKDPPGCYRNTKYPCLEIVHKPFVDPEFVKSSIKWNEESYEEDLERFMSGSEFRAALVHPTPRLVEMLKIGDVISYLPSIQALTGKLWIRKGKGPPMTNRALIRIYRNIIGRVKFPFTRRPLILSDEHRDMYPAYITIPKIVRKDHDEMYKELLFEPIMHTDYKSVELELEPIYGALEPTAPPIAIPLGDVVRGKALGMLRLTQIKDQVATLGAWMQEDRFEQDLKYLEDMEDFMTLYKRVQDFMSMGERGVERREEKPPDISEGDLQIDNEDELDVTDDMLNEAMAATSSLYKE